jgi:hypothetical protein
MSPACTAHRPLDTETWTPSSYDAVVLAVLKADWKRRHLNERGDPRLILEPDLLNPAHNTTRFGLLHGLDGLLWESVPQDTAWFEVRHVGVHHFGQLRHIHHLKWSVHSASKTNAVLEIAPIRRERMRPSAVPDAWRPVLWGHSRDAPLTILDGNHRLAALAQDLRAYRDLKLVCYVGLSRALAVWHRPDVP